MKIELCAYCLVPTPRLPAARCRLQAEYALFAMRLELYLNIHPCRKIELHQGIYRLLGRLDYIQ